MSEPDEDRETRPPSKIRQDIVALFTEGVRYYLVINPKRFQQVPPKFSRVLEKFESDGILVATTFKPNRPLIESAMIMSPPKSNIILVVGGEEYAKNVAEKLLDVYEAKEIMDITAEIISAKEKEVDNEED